MKSEIPKWFHDESNCWGYIGKGAVNGKFMERHNPGQFLVKGNDIYMRFESDSAYLEWWQDRFS